MCAQEWAWSTADFFPGKKCFGPVHVQLKQRKMTPKAEMNKNVCLFFKWAFFKGRRKHLNKANWAGPDAAKTGGWEAWESSKQCEHFLHMCFSGQVWRHILQQVTFWPGAFPPAPAPHHWHHDSRPCPSRSSFIHSLTPPGKRLEFKFIKVKLTTSLPLFPSASLASLPLMQKY